VFWAAKALGFYASSTAAFFAIYSLYDPASLFDIRAWLKRIVVTAIFMVIIYGLFAELLNVQTPRGMFDNLVIPIFALIVKPLKVAITYLVVTFRG